MTVLFESLSQVPGVNWEPDGVPAAPQRVEPVFDWQTPAKLALMELWQAGPDGVTQAAVDGALCAPGSRNDYHSILAVARGTAALSSAAKERMCRLDISLVLGDPEAAASGLGQSRRDDVSGAFLDLLRLYVAEGFLVEAADVERQLDRLPREFQPRYDWGERPTALLAALHDLTP